MSLSHERPLQFKICCSPFVSLLISHVTPHLHFICPTVSKICFWKSCDQSVDLDAPARKRCSIVASRIWQSECCSRITENRFLMTGDIWIVFDAAVILSRINSLGPEPLSSAYGRERGGYVACLCAALVLSSKSPSWECFRSQRKTGFDIGIQRFS